MNFERKVHNFFMRENGGSYDPKVIDVFKRLQEYSPEETSYKVAVVMIAINHPYWQYMPPIVEDIHKYFLPGHKTDILMWTDCPVYTDAEWDSLSREIDEAYAKEEKLPQDKSEKFFSIVGKYLQIKARGRQLVEKEVSDYLSEIGIPFKFILVDGKPVPASEGDVNVMLPHLYKATKELLFNTREAEKKCTFIPTEPIEWPYPTLMRYSLFLGEEERLKEYDYIFYIDLDMRMVNYVGDEILGPGLTIAPHPGYYIRKELYPPYEPNAKSASYIKRPGKVVLIDGKPRFMPFYAAGGFQGGKTKQFIKAMKHCKKLIDKDLNVNNYIPIWNDETTWNKYVFDYQTPEEIDQTVFLDPSYVFPDSLIQEYYFKIWGKHYQPRLITITKKFSIVKGGFDELSKRLQTM